MANLICVPPEDVWKIWPGKVSVLIDAAYAANDQFLPPTILDELRAGTKLLWLAIDGKDTIVAAMLTALYPMRSGKMCKMMECGGEHLEDWKHMRSQIEEYAKAEGCVRVMCEGRPGWAKVLSDYQMIGVIMEKRI